MHKSSRLTSSAEGMAQGQGASAGVDLIHVKATHRLAPGQSLRCELLGAHRHHVGEYLACMYQRDRRRHTDVSNIQCIRREELVAALHCSVV